MNRSKFLSPAFALAAWMMVTAAAPYEDAARLYEKGEFLDAASLAASDNTASSLALAARAYLAYAIYKADPAQRATEVQKGAALASKALTLDPNHVEAHLQLVVALYQKGRAATPIGAYFRGYAEEARSHLDTALRLEPENPWVHSALGGWHFEVVRLAGPLLAENLYGASLTDGRTAFSKAIALQPGNIVMQFNFARALLLSDPDTNRTEAVRALETALAATPANHLDTIMAARARTVLNAANSASPEALQWALESDGF
jgi:uncharacterized tellurite resistance protein B-like protein